MLNKREIGERVRKAAEMRHMTLKKLAELSGIPYRSLQNYISGRQLPGADALARLHQSLGININWLLVGKGDPFDRGIGFDAKLFAIVGVLFDRALRESGIEGELPLPRHYWIAQLYNEALSHREHGLLTASGLRERVADECKLLNEIMHFSVSLTSPTWCLPGNPDDKTIDALLDADTRTENLVVNMPVPSSPAGLET